MDKSRAEKKKSKHILHMFKDEGIELEFTCEIPCSNHLRFLINKMLKCVQSMFAGSIFCIEWDHDWILDWRIRMLFSEEWWYRTYARRRKKNLGTLHEQEGAMSCLYHIASVREQLICTAKKKKSIQTTFTRKETRNVAVNPCTRFAQSERKFNAIQGEGCVFHTICLTFLCRAQKVAGVCSGHRKVL